MTAKKTSKKTVAKTDTETPVAVKPKKSVKKKDSVPVLTVEDTPSHTHISSVENEVFVDPEHTSGVGKKKAALITTIFALIVVGILYLVF